MSDTNGTGNGNGTQTEGGALKVRMNEVVRKEFGATQVARSGETASSAMAAQARAMIEARFVMALQRPRDIDNARVRLLNACKRPGFAKAARYRKPIGQGIEGPSIRLAEEAARCMGNIAIDISVIFDDETRRVMRVSATDLEVNLPISFDVTVEKTIERNSVPDGAAILRQRTGASGKTVYILQATDDDILNKANALASKALRGCILRLVPADIQEEAMATVYATLRDAAAKDPDAERKSVIDAFASLKVLPNMLKDYLGHEVGTCSPAEIVDLRDVYTTIKDGEATWNEVIEHKRRQRQEEGGETPTTTSATPPPEGKRISLKPAATPATSPAAAGAARPADQLPLGRSDVANSTTEVKTAKEGATVAGKLTSVPPAGKPPVARAGAKPVDDGGGLIDKPPVKTAEREPGDDFEAEEAANRKAAEPSDDDMPPWGKR